MIENRMQPLKIEISHRTIIFTALFLISLWFAYQIRQIIFLLFVSLIFASALEPLVRSLEKLKFPRWLAILTVYACLVVFLGIGFAGIIPPLVDQTAVLISNLPNFLRQAGLLGVDQTLINSQLSQLGSIPANLFKFIVGIFSNIATAFVVLVVTFYILLERQNLDAYLNKLLGTDNKKEVVRIINLIEARIGGWVRGELVLMGSIGLLSYFGFRILGIEFAVPLAILAGLLEIVPNIGPTIAAVPAILAGLILSPLHGLATLAWAFLVQQVENNFIVPKVMQKVAGINPLITILSLSIGFKLAGIAGATLAVPIVLILEVLIFELFTKKLQD